MMMMMKNMMMMMTMMMMMMMPGNVDDGSSVNCSATYRSKRPSDAVRPRPRSTLNFHLNWSQLANYRDPAMLFVRDRPWIGRLGWLIWICQYENNLHPELVWNGQLSRPVFCWYKYKVNPELVDKKYIHMPAMVWNDQPSRPRDAIMKDRSPSWIRPNIDNDDDCADDDYHAKDQDMHTRATSTLEVWIGLNWSSMSGSPTDLKCYQKLWLGTLTNADDALVMRIGLNWFVQDQLPPWITNVRNSWASQILRNQHHCSMGHCHLLLLLIIIITIIIITIIMLLTGAGVRRAEVVCANDSPSEPRLKIKFTFFGRSLCSRYWWSVRWNFD